MIGPSSMSVEDIETASDEEIVAAYMADGFDRRTAEAFLAARTSGFIVD
jgi:hypothetical protein